jgi:hypothetical protein
VHARVLCPISWSAAAHLRCYSTVRRPAHPSVCQLYVPDSSLPPQLTANRRGGATQEELSRSKPKGPDLKSRSLKKTISSRTLGGFTHTVVNGITDFTFAAASAADITIRTLNMLNPMGRDTLRRQASIAPLPSEPGTPQEEDEDSKRQRMNALLVVQREEFRKALDERNRPPHWWFIHPESQSLQVRVSPPSVGMEPPTTSHQITRGYAEARVPFLVQATTT